MKTVLQFSGGKDSLACLYLLKPRWEEILVVWLNTGAALPQMIEQMLEIRDRVPNFLEVMSRQTIAERGWPVDIVPTRSTPVGYLSTGRWPEQADKPLFQSRFDCCAATIWRPLHEAMKQVGAQVVIRGQKLCDHMRSPIVDGQIVEGIEYQFPLAHWSDADVERYLKEQGVIPACGEFIPNSSLDCWNCTAYLDESGSKLNWLKKHYPEKHGEVMRVLRSLQQDVNAERSHLDTLLVEQA